MRAVIVAALVALPLGALAPSANAACEQVGPLEICSDGMGDIEIPGIIKVCIRFNTQCGS